MFAVMSMFVNFLLYPPLPLILTHLLPAAPQPPSLWGDCSRTCTRCQRSPAKGRPLLVGRCSCVSVLRTGPMRSSSWCLCSEPPICHPAASPLVRCSSCSCCLKVDAGTRPRPGRGAATPPSETALSSRRVLILWELGPNWGGAFNPESICWANSPLQQHLYCLGVPTDQVDKQCPIA